ncbi:pilus assembly protein N-terminal domain-containing protein [Caenispirillum bisanense]|uniref:pilus assembly protein N-terminal domain-containing protein n=1 Tax=Caenispirillum bisanense TaxID=414052 RepID=UPI0031D3C25B
MRRALILLPALMLSAAAAMAADKAPSPAAPATERADPFTAPIVPIPDPEPGAAEDDGDDLPVLEMTVGSMQLVRLGEVPTTTIDTFPGIVSVGVEPPDMLFIFAEKPGETQLIIADSNYVELFARTIVVTAPE